MQLAAFTVGDTACSKELMLGAISTEKVSSKIVVASTCTKDMNEPAARDISSTKILSAPCDVVHNGADVWHVREANSTLSHACDRPAWSSDTTPQTTVSSILRSLASVTDACDRVVEVSSVQ